LPEKREERNGDYKTERGKVEVNLILCIRGKEGHATICRIEKSKICDQNFDIASRDLERRAVKEENKELLYVLQHDVVYLVLNGQCPGRAQ
jgi:hypothetical protein